MELLHNKCIIFKNRCIINCVHFNRVDISHCIRDCRLINRNHIYYFKSYAQGCIRTVEIQAEAINVLDFEFASAK